MATPLANYTVGQAPGQNQVNLGAMQGNLANLLGSGNLGNNTANPMTSIIADKGQSQLGYQNAIANSRMADTGLKSEEQALQQAQQAWETQQQQPGIMDYLALALGVTNYGSSVLNGKGKNQNPLSNSQEADQFMNSLNLPSDLEG